MYCVKTPDENGCAYKMGGQNEMKEHMAYLPQSKNTPNTPIALKQGDRNLLQLYDKRMHFTWKTVYLQLNKRSKAVETWP